MKTQEKFYIVDCFVIEILQGGYYSGFSRHRFFVSIKLQEAINYIKKAFKESELNCNFNKRNLYKHFTTGSKEKLLLNSENCQAQELTIHKEKMLVNDKNEFSKIEFYESREVIDITD